MLSLMPPLFIDFDGFRHAISLSPLRHFAMPLLLSP
jgi:hypothetical protein